MEAAESISALATINKDLKIAARTMSSREARYLVDTYYMIQSVRIREGNQQSAMIKLGEPHFFIDFALAQSEMLEEQIKNALNIYSKYHPFGTWTRSITGIGPVIAAGLIAFIDIERAHSAGAIWRYAGLDPSCVWDYKNGQKRPWNAALKVLCWKLGESFVKVKGNKSDFYGKLYEKRKEYETFKNENKDYAEQAAKILEVRKIQDKKARAILESGMLVPAHIHARCKRYAVKIFLSHLYDMMHEIHYGKPAPIPYVIQFLGHKDMIEVPNRHLFSSAREAYIKRLAQ